jgi:hypothetical protein
MQVVGNESARPLDLGMMTMVSARRSGSLAVAWNAHRSRKILMTITMMTTIFRLVE